MNGNFEEINPLDSEEEKLKLLKKISQNMGEGKISLEKKEDIDKVLILLEDNSDIIRIKVTEIMEMSQNEILVDKLIDKLLNDKNYYVRGFAAKALGSIGNMKAKESLEKAKDDPEGFVRSFVENSLKIINMKLSFSSKLEMLKAKMKEGKK